MQSIGISCLVLILENCLRHTPNSQLPAFVKCVRRRRPSVCPDRASSKAVRPSDRQPVLSFLPSTPSVRRSKPSVHPSLEAVCPSWPSARPSVTAVCASVGADRPPRRNRPSETVRNRPKPSETVRPKPSVRPFRPSRPPERNRPSVGLGRPSVPPETIWSIDLKQGS